MLITTAHQFVESLRTGPYTSVGSYPLFWLASDGGTLSHAACKANAGRIARAIRDNDRTGGWLIVGCDVNWEDPDMRCAHTDERIESAYAEDDRNAHGHYGTHETDAGGL